MNTVKVRKGSRAAFRTFTHLSLEAHCSMGCFRTWISRKSWLSTPVVNCHVNRNMVLETATHHKTQSTSDMTETAVWHSNPTPLQRLPKLTRQQHHAREVCTTPDPNHHQRRPLLSQAPPSPIGRALLPSDYHRGVSSFFTGPRTAVTPLVVTGRRVTWSSGPREGPSVQPCATCVTGWVSRELLGATGATSILDLLLLRRLSHRHVVS